MPHKYDIVVYHLPNFCVRIYPNMQDRRPNVSPVSSSPLSVLHCLSSTCNPRHPATSQSFLASVLSPQTLVFSHQSSILIFLSSVISPQSSVLSLQSSVILPQSSVLNHQSLVFHCQVPCLVRTTGLPEVPGP